MGLLDIIRNTFRRSAPDTGSGAQAPQQPQAQAEPSAARQGRDLYTLPLVQNTALNVATVYRCVNFLADKVANLPLQYQRLKGDIFANDVNSRLHYLLTVQPSENLSAFDFWWLAVNYMLLKGNAYIVPVYDPVTMDFARLVIVNPQCVAHDTINDTYTVNDVEAGISGVYFEDEIIHLKNYTRDGKHGISTLTFARTVLEIATTGDAETLNRFQNGGNVRGIVSNDTSVRGFGEYQDTELQKTATDLDERFRAGERIVSLPGQAQFNPISLSSTDMQFLESRKFTVLDICRFFGVHPSFVFEDTSSNYKSAELANAAFLSDTLNPLLRKIEVELLRKLVAPSLATKRKFEFNRAQLYACDLNSKVKYQTAAIAAGIYTVNEVRREENKPAVEGGDVVFISANLKSILDTGTTSPAPAAKEPENDKEDGKEDE